MNVRFDQPVLPGSRVMAEQMSALTFVSALRDVFSTVMEMSTAPSRALSVTEISSSSPTENVPERPWGVSVQRPRIVWSARL